MRQIWRHLTFLHWRYDPAVIAPTLPPGLTLDTYDNSAWIGLVPFVLSGVQPYGFPAFPWISEFPETNVRTYVRDASGHRGVWFYTLEAARLPAVVLARTWYHLPYRWASMHVRRNANSVEYFSRRGQRRTEIAVEPGAPMQAGEFDIFLTARFRLYTATRGRIAFAQIEHDPWPLQHATVTKLNQTLIEQFAIPSPSGPPIVHYSEELHVKAEGLRWL